MREVAALAKKDKVSISISGRTGGARHIQGQVRFAEASLPDEQFSIASHR
jgi:hypothetical protein